LSSMWFKIERKLERFQWKQRAEEKAISVLVLFVTKYAERGDELHWCMIDW
jgi:hypothetical protein